MSLKIVENIHWTICVFWMIFSAQTTRDGSAAGFSTATAATATANARSSAAHANGQQQHDADE